MLDAVGASLAWLADLTWYAAMQGHVAPHVGDQPCRVLSTRIVRSVAGMMWLLSATAWCAARGAVMGLACTLVAGMVSATIQRPLASLFPRLVIASGVVAAALAVALVLGATSGA